MENMLIKTEIQNHIAVVTMDAPPVNAQSKDFVEEFIATFDELNETPSVRVIVLTGAGKTFSAGADIKSRGKVGAVPGDTLPATSGGRVKSVCIMGIQRPVIAAVSLVQYCAGMGLAVCSTSFSHPNAVFASAGNRHRADGGVAYDAAVPHTLARRMVLSGYWVPQPNCTAGRIIEDCVPLDHSMPQQR
jgi:enoyl-CoA hydratase/carnithine racemase